jgi:hypothetical protein
VIILGCIEIHPESCIRQVGFINFTLSNLKEYRILMEAELNAYMQSVKVKSSTN